jgi:hypothetical protein
VICVTPDLTSPQAAAGILCEVTELTVTQHTTRQTQAPTALTSLRGAFPEGGLHCPSGCRGPAATELAAASVAAGGQLLAGYADAHAFETVAGAINIALALLAAVLGTVRPSLRRSRP